MKTGAKFHQESAIFLLQSLELLSLSLRRFHLTFQDVQLLHVSVTLFPRPPRLPLLFGPDVGLPHLVKHPLLPPLLQQQLPSHLHQGSLLGVQLLLPPPALGCPQLLAALPGNSCAGHFKVMCDFLTLLDSKS